MQPSETKTPYQQLADSESELGKLVNTKKRGLLLKQLGAILTSGVSLVVYIVGTSDAAALIRCSGVATNFIMGWFGGNETINFLSQPTKSLTGSASKRAKASKIIFVVTAAATNSTSLAIATYQFTAGSLGKRIGLAILQGVGTFFLRGYHFSLLVENELTYLASSIYNCCLFSEQANSLRLMQTTLTNNLARALKLTKKLGPIPTNSNFHFSEELSSRHFAWFAELINANPAPPATSAWLRYLSNITRTVIGGISGLTVASGLTGYVCSTHEIVQDWTGSAFLLMGGTYFAIKGGYQLSTQFYDWVTEGFPRTFSWQLYGKKSILSLLTPLIATFSGYMGKKLYDKFCPWAEKTHAVDNTIYWLVAFFNAIHVYLATQSATTGYKRYWGSDPEKTYILIIEALTELHKQIKHMNLRDFEQFANNHLRLLDENMRNTFLDTHAAQEAWRAWNRSALLGNHGGASTAPLLGAQQAPSLLP